MQRVLAAVVAVAMLSASGSAAWQHVHAYVDHDHADHHHGPASHRHSAVADARSPDAHSPGAHAPDSHRPNDDSRLEGCDPGEHAVSVVLACVTPQPHHVLATDTLETILVAPLEQTMRHVAPSDVRAHSPPRLTDAPLRAPPVVHPA